MAKFILKSVIAIAVGMQAFSSLDAQMTSSSAEAQCRRTLDSQNRFCANKPSSGWNSQQSCLDRNQNFYERCMRNANVTNRSNNNRYRNPDNQPYSTGDNE